MVQRYRWADLPVDRLSPECSRQMVVGERAMVCLFRYAPSAREPMHHHESEQFSWVIRGRLRFLLPGQSIEAGPGDVVHIPSNVRHGAEVLAEETEVLEVFSPIRPDFLGGRAPGQESRG
jgi:quercetin dioxygenase-like cupin family protein